MVEGVWSREEVVLSGVPQRTVLGPLLFILYIKDLPSQVHQDTCCRLFANDCQVYHAIHSKAEQVILQQDLRNLEQCTADWGLIFNPSKYSIMSVHKGRNHLRHFSVLCSIIRKSTEQDSKPKRTRNWDLSNTTCEDVLTTSNGLPISPWYGAASSMPAVCGTLSSLRILTS